MTRPTFFLTLVLSLGVAFSAVATAKSPLPVAERQADLRVALERPDFGIYSQRVSFTERGRRDLVLFAKAPSVKVVETLKAAFRANTAALGGYEVMGYAHIVPTDSWTFTLRKDGQMFVAEVGARGAGSRITLWGAAFQAGSPAIPARPLPQAQVTTSTGQELLLR